MDDREIVALEARECDCRGRDPYCPKCNPGGIVRLAASRRTRNRFLAGVVSGSLLNILFPILLPVSVTAVLSSSLFFRLRAAPQLLAGAIALAFFWLWMLPKAGEEPGTAGLLIISLFLLPIFFFFARPGRLAAHELLFRGRGLLGGVLLSSTVVSALLSSAALIGLAFF